MESVRTYDNDGLRLTVVKYIMSGKTQRVLIKSPEGNYFMDLSLHSFMERSFVNTFISIVKVLSFVVSALQIDVNKIIN